MAEMNDNEDAIEHESETTTKKIESTGEKLNANVTPRETSEINQLIDDDKRKRDQQLYEEVADETTILGRKPIDEEKQPRFVCTSSMLTKLVGIFGSIVLILVFAVGYLFTQIQSMQSDRLSEKEIVFYPFDEANIMLKNLGYDFSAVKVYNSNMIRILNEQGKVVLPKATVHGDVPNELVVQLMSVDEMNALADEQQ